MTKRIVWNKGLKLSEIPQYSKMGFQKGNRNWDNANTKSIWFQVGHNKGQKTQFSQGHKSWNAGLKGWNIGEKNGFWKGGFEFRKKDEKKHLCSKYKEWTLSVKKRDKWKCRISNKDCSGILESHHILNWIDYPELRYDIKNGITLCHAHHPRKWVEELRLIPEFQSLVLTTNEKII